MRKTIAKLGVILVSIVSIYIGYNVFKSFKTSIDINNQTSQMIMNSYTNGMSSMDSFLNVNIGDTLSILGSQTIEEYEKVEVAEFYDNLSFSTKDGRLVKLIGVSLNMSNEDKNLQLIRNLIKDKTLYLVKDKDIKDDENDYLYRYIYSSEPTKNDNVETSLNAYLIRRGFGNYNEMFNTNDELRLKRISNY